MKKESECVKVVVRVRPFNQKEKDNNSKPCVNADEKLNVVELIKVINKLMISLLKMTQSSFHMITFLE